MSILPFDSVYSAMQRGDSDSLSSAIKEEQKKQEENATFHKILGSMVHEHRIGSILVDDVGDLEYSSLVRWWVLPTSVRTILSDKLMSSLEECKGEIPEDDKSLNMLVNEITAADKVVLPTPLVGIVSSYLCPPHKFKFRVNPNGHGQNPLIQVEFGWFPLLPTESIEQGTVYFKGFTLEVVYQPTSHVLTFIQDVTSSSIIWTLSAGDATFLCKLRPRCDVEINHAKCLTCL